MILGLRSSRGGFLVLDRAIYELSLQIGPCLRVLSPFNLLRELNHGLSWETSMRFWELMSVWVVALLTRLLAQILLI